MPEHVKQQAGGSDKSGKLPLEQTAKDHSRSGFLDKSIIQSVPMGIVAFDTDLRVLQANPRANELIDLGDYIDKSLAEGTDEQIWQGWTDHLKSAISTGKPCTFDDVGYTSGGKTRLLRIICTALKEAGTTGTPGGMVIIEDVSEKVDTQRKLAHAEKLAAVGRHASKVAHELNNPLDGILRYVNLAMRTIEQENLQKPKEYLDQCRQGLMRMVRIVGELLEFSRSTYTPMEHAKIEQIVEDALRTMESKAKALDIRILRDYTRGMPQIRSGNLFQVFCNLTKNALDAMHEGGELKISTRPAADGAIVIEFRDTGAGLPAKNAEAIFEPFFTTKDKGKGTGLGLAICRDIVESCHGRITAENAPDGGSIFTVYLPVAG
ncbi:MAG: ATP-binding protein [Planctomycetota bacterium]